MQEYEYAEGVTLISNKEWRVWCKFLNGRIAHLSNKVITQVRNSEFENAAKTVAVIDDIKNQINTFLSKINEIQNKQ